MMWFRRLPRVLASLISNPFVGMGTAAILIALLFRTLRGAPPDRQAFHVASLSLVFALFTWLIVEVKRWPYMQLDGLSDRENAFEIHSQDGAFAAIAWFRFLNKSSSANTVLRCEYWLRVTESGGWHHFEPSLTGIDTWLKDQLEVTRHLYLKFPEVYQPHTAGVRYAAFSGKVPWQRNGDERPPVYLRARFEMADGGAETVEVQLKWVGTLPNIRSQPWVH